jgi:hypothetical protein
MYADESNTNGKKNGVPSLLGDITTEYIGRQIGGGLGASVFTVLRRRVEAQRAARAVAPPPPTITAVRRVIGGLAPVIRPTPAVNIVSLPNGTAVPVPTNGAAPPVSAPTGPGYYPGITSPSQLPDFDGGYYGPPPSSPVEVGTLPPDDGGASNIATAGLGDALAGITGNKAVLAGVALLAFFMLDGKPKRRRR